jgi:hypothetical protein
MGTKTVTYTLTATNKCGDTQWFNESNNYQVTVYRKPRTPSSLKKKGNGSSKILVFDFDSLNDEELSGYNYKFVYGYTDSAGDHWKGQTNKRYFQADDINLRYYVYSVWDYGNDIKVTSDKRYLDKTSVDPFDGCNFPDNNVTRSGDSDLSAIRDASVGSFQAKGAHLVAYFPTPVSGIISICDVNGNAVRQQRLHGSSYYDVQADLSGLKSGMYLIRYAVGNQEQTEKVIVK